MNNQMFTQNSYASQAGSIEGRRSQQIFSFNPQQEQFQRNTIQDRRDLDSIIKRYNTSTNSITNSNQKQLESQRMNNNNFQSNNFQNILEQDESLFQSDNIGVSSQMSYIPKKNPFINSGISMQQSEFQSNNFHNSQNVNNSNNFNKFHKFDNLNMNSIAQSNQLQPINESKGVRLTFGQNSNLEQQQAQFQKNNQKMETKPQQVKDSNNIFDSDEDDDLTNKDVQQQRINYMHAEISVMQDQVHKLLNNYQQQLKTTTNKDKLKVQVQKDAELLSQEYNNILDKFKDLSQHDISLVSNSRFEQSGAHQSFFQGNTKKEQEINMMMSLVEEFLNKFDKEFTASNSNLQSQKEQSDKKPAFNQQQQQQQQYLQQQQQYIQQNNQLTSQQTSQVQSANVSQRNTISFTNNLQNQQHQQNMNYQTSETPLFRPSVPLTVTQQQDQKNMDMLLKIHKKDHNDNPFFSIYASNNLQANQQSQVIQHQNNELQQNDNQILYCTGCDQYFKEKVYFDHVQRCNNQQQTHNDTNINKSTINDTFYNLDQSYSLINKLDEKLQKIIKNFEETLALQTLPQTQQILKQTIQDLKEVLVTQNHNTIKKIIKKLESNSSNQQNQISSHKLYLYLKTVMNVLKEKEIVLEQSSQLKDISMMCDNEEQKFNNLYNHNIAPPPQIQFSNDLDQKGKFYDLASSIKKQLHANHFGHSLLISELYEEAKNLPQDQWIIYLKRKFNI